MMSVSMFFSEKKTYNPSKRKSDTVRNREKMNISLFQFSTVCTVYYFSCNSYADNVVTVRRLSELCKYSRQNASIYFLKAIAVYFSTLIWTAIFFAVVFSQDERHMRISLHLITTHFQNVSDTVMISVKIIVFPFVCSVALVK